MTEWETLVSDPNEYKQMILDILEEDESDISQNVFHLLSNLEPDQGCDKLELDMKLRILAGNVPYNMLIPMLREQLGLTIKTDDQCIFSLNSLKEHLELKNIMTVNKIVNFMNGEYLDNDIVPEIDLMGMVDQIPIEKYPILLNCIDYISETTEISEESSSEKE